MKRVLITGSRDWVDEATIRDALQAEWETGAVLVHGACPSGADSIADRLWTGAIEPHPAEWSRYGRRAGPIRNAAMVARGADVCLAFIRRNSRGACHLANLAEQAGIRTIRFEVAS